MSTAVIGSAGLDLNQLDVTTLLRGTVTTETDTTYVEEFNGQVITFVGADFTYDSFGLPTGGTVTGLQVTIDGALLYQVTDMSIPVTTWVDWANNADTLGALNGVFAGADVVQGSIGDDTLSGFAGDDSLSGGAGDDLLVGGGSEFLTGGSGDDTVAGGAGNDSLIGTDGQNFLTGGDGDDSIRGGSDFDRTNGNAGNDIVHGNDGNDWVTGGKDSDTLFGDAGDDILNGNLGSDTADGGTGADTVRGGQGDDMLSGGEGNDLLTGDLGDDTMAGGAGADAFRAFDGGGNDVITDFSAADGDHVVVDAGSAYTVAQVDVDTVITFTATGNHTVLTGVTLADLPNDWISGG